ncbi:MAG: ATP synthase subunit I [Thermodesulfobacteriaceae bacterium]|nr:ATP synthase subunit I [Thermodesulfobacteriaceae bacterium]MCX8041355.1 ATP synthase subunit I [Thermodesulfobacteriaceae bacterium]MDW8135639.1 ATP synthase subunit I [Thermodesulfobacterium sp.]
MNQINVEKFSKEVEIYVGLTSLIGSLLIFFIWQNFIFLLSFLVGNLLGLVNLRAIKKEVIKMISKLQSKELQYPQAGVLYFIKFILRLFLIAVILYLLLVELKFDVIFILLGFSSIYLHLFLVTLKNYLRNKLIPN